jgi:hypothetical protein
MADDSNAPLSVPYAHVEHQREIRVVQHHLRAFAKRLRRLAQRCVGRQVAGLYPHARVTLEDVALPQVLHRIREDLQCLLFRQLGVWLFADGRIVRLYERIRSAAD